MRAGAGDRRLAPASRTADTRAGRRALAADPRIIPAMTDLASATDVLIVGAGPTGLMTAVQLARRGVACRVIDRLPERSDRSRALVVHARTLELLQRFGAADDLLAAGRTALSGNLHVRGRLVARLPLGDIGVDDTPFPFLLFVSQVETERVLEDTLRRHGVAVERPVALVDFSQDQGGVTATLERDGRREPVRCRYLVGADGSHSAVRHGLGLTFEGDAYPQRFMLADAAVDGDLEPGLHIFFGTGGGLVAFFAMRGERRFRVLGTRPGRDDATGDPPLAELQALVDSVCGRPLPLRDVTWLTAFRLHHRGVDRYGEGRVFVAGDAAHIHSPAGGQGMNTGIQDAENLAWKLALVLWGRAPTSLLASYHAERHPVGQKLLAYTDRLFTIGSSRNPAVIWLRNLVAPRLAPRVLAERSRRARVFRFVSQLGIRYRGSPIVGEDRSARAHFSGGPAPGERAPDAPILLADGASATLFAVLARAEFTLLVFPGARDPATALAAIRELMNKTWRLGDLVAPVVVSRGPVGGSDPARIGDPDGALHARYGLARGGDGLVLIRPDGYVAYRGVTDCDALHAALTKLVLPPHAPHSS